ncbi:MAG: glucuronide transporter [Shewanella sp.]
MESKLSKASFIGYGLGDSANNFAFAMGALFLLNYYTDVAGIGATEVGTMLLLVRVFDAFADVIAGRFVDKTNTKYGKFRPFLLFVSPVLLIFGILVFYVPTHWEHDAKLIYAYITYAGLGLAYSFVNIPYGSLATVMAQSPQDRAKLGMSRTIGGTLVYISLAFFLGPKILHSSPAEMEGVYQTTTITLAVIGMLLYYICFKTSKEVVTRSLKQPSLKESLNTLKKNNALMMLCFAAVCTLVGSFSVSASLLYYVRYVLGKPELFSTIVIIQIGAGIIVAPFIPKLTSLIGKKNVFLSGIGISALGNIIFFFFSTPETSTIIIFALITVIALGMGCAMTIMWALEADTVEYGEFITGVRIEGLTYSLFSFFRKCGQAVGGSVPAFILGATGFIANAPSQTHETILGIRGAMTLAPSGFLFIAFIIMLFYPLTDKKFTEMVKEIGNRQEKTKGRVKP